MGRRHLSDPLSRPPDAVRLPPQRRQPSARIPQETERRVRPLHRSFRAASPALLLIPPPVSLNRASDRCLVTPLDTLDRRTPALLMTSTSTNAQNPPTVAAAKPSAPANPSSSGSSAVAAGQAAPTARSSYANATKSPPIANSAAPVVVGGQQHGKSISPVNGNSIKPAVPAMGPTIANGAASHGDHSRKSSVTISAAGTSGYIPNGGPVPNSRAPSNLTFGSLAGSPAPAHAVPHSTGQNLNPQAQNPRVASPAHSPSPIPAPISSGGKPDNLPTRPNLVFGGGNDSADSNVS